VENAVEAMEASQHDEAAAARVTAARATVRECEAKLARYRAGLTAAPTRPWSVAGSSRLRPNGPSPNWTCAGRRVEAARAATRSATSSSPFGDRTVIRDAEPADKAEVYWQLGLKLNFDR